MSVSRAITETLRALVTQLDHGVSQRLVAYESLLNLFVGPGVIDTRAGKRIDKDTPLSGQSGHPKVVLVGDGFFQSGIQRSEGGRA